MLQRIILVLLFALVATTALPQVKASYLYNTSMPYGTLDLRTGISASNYYYLVPGKTFSFRESSPGVRTDSWFDMTNWDSSPYEQGHMRHRNGSQDNFVMNYRLLFPENYQSTYQQGYPLIVIMHGAVERGNCYYAECYHGDWEYDPNSNTPPAPTNADHKLLNNDHHLSIGANQHLAARNRAGSKLPDDPALDPRAFPGFVLMPQMFNDWDSLNVEKAIKIVLLHIKEYNIDPNRVYIHGLSIGGYATYEAIKRAPWLFAAALPMSAVREAGNIFRHNQQHRVTHIPLWVFQGGRDSDPTVAWTAGVLNKLRHAGSIVRYSEYSDLGHNVWNRAYNEPDFFSWMLSHNKANVHALHGKTVIDFTANTFPTLVMAEGFFVYQWEKDGQRIAGATGNVFTPNAPGTYRARFSRVASPSASDWNQWSEPVVVTSVGTPPGDDEEEDNPDDDDPGDEATPDNGDDSEGEDTTGGEDDQDNNSDEEDNPGGQDNSDGEDTAGGEHNDNSSEDNSGEDNDAGGNDNTDEDEGTEEETPADNDENPNPVTHIPAQTNFEVSVFPNPGRAERIRVTLPDAPIENYQYRVIDPLGRAIAGGSSNRTDDVQLGLPPGLPPGIYILVISGKARGHVARIAITNE